MPRQLIRARTTARLCPRETRVTSSGWPPHCSNSGTMPGRITSVRSSEGSLARCARTRSMAGSRRARCHRQRDSSQWRPQHAPAAVRALLHREEAFAPGAGVGIRRTERREIFRNPDAFPRVWSVHVRQAGQSFLVRRLGRLALRRERKHWRRHRRELLRSAHRGSVRQHLFHRRRRNGATFLDVDNIRSPRQPA